ncbi:MAG: TraR/DksA C4-type zinc finger protein [Spirochaetia bacterium]|nr:TraR/DksA C4-type zinc finger protein [Spirochaetia bacterium]
MDNNDQKKLRNRIQNEIDNIRQDIKNLEEITKPISPDVSLGRLTRMDAIAAKGVNEAALNDARQKLHKLEEALANLKKSSYGMCQICGKKISDARMEFMPECTTCVDCAS